MSWGAIITAARERSYGGRGIEGKVRNQRGNGDEENSITAEDQKKCEARTQKYLFYKSLYLCIFNMVIISQVLRKKSTSKFNQVNERRGDEKKNLCFFCSLSC